MKFLKKPTKAWLKLFTNKNAPDECPQKGKCFPCGLVIGQNAAGTCAGLNPCREDLDVVTLCIFSENIKSEIQCEWYCLAPDEAIEIIRALSKALDECFVLHQPYQKLKSQNRDIFQQRRRRYKRKLTKEEDAGEWVIRP